MELFFRYDDLAARGWHGAEAGELQLMILDEFAAAGVPLTVAAIPMATNSSEHPLASDQRICDAWLDAVSAGRVDPAVHGHTHLNFAPAGLGRRSEFVGRPFAAQLAALVAGKHAVEGVLMRPVGTLVPPWNTFDDNTLRAAEACGFTAFSASTQPVQRPHNGRALRWLPVTTDLSELPELLATGHTPLPRGTVLGVVLHIYDFYESGDRRAWLRLEDLRALFARCRDAGFSFSTVGALSSANAQDFSVGRYRANILAARLARSRRLPHLIRAERGRAFAKWYWPRKAVWLQLTRACTPLSTIWDAARF